MPRIRINDTSELRELCKGEFKKLRKDRRVTKTILLSAYVLSVFWAIDLVLSVYFHRWLNVVTCLSGWLLVLFIMHMQMSVRRTYVLRSKLLRAQLKTLKHIESINIDVSFHEVPVLPPTKPKVH